MSTNLNDPDRYGTIGWQEFVRQKQEILNLFDRAKEDNRNRPVQTEHGNVGEAGFRQWLRNFLPAKYGVTSGFIIPDVRASSYKIKHYDVIIYDSVNSPVLWGSNNPDNSEQGRSRAIPAPHVHAVLEVKSTLNKESILKSKEKLRELNDYVGHLSKHFVSGAIFMETMASEHSSCKIVEHLYDNDIVGYFGGVVLRATTFDENMTGYFQFYEGDSDSAGTTDDMPLVREIGKLQRNDQGDPMLTQQGDTCTAYSLDGVWNFDKGYSLNIKNVHIYWSYNSFTSFAFDLLDRFQGCFTPLENGKENKSMQGSYGMSFFK